MSDAHRSDAHDAGSGQDADRDARIEQLLLLGLDHYFAANYELAINVWTRALFFDRSHPRARAYIERARNAIAERQRESEELLHTGVAAFHRGEGDEARRLLQAAIAGGAPSDEALAVLDRLNLVEPVAPPAASLRTGRPMRVRAPFETGRPRRSAVAAAVAAVFVGLIVAGAFAAERWDIPVEQSFASLVRSAGNVTLTPAAAPASTVSKELPLALPLQGETTLVRAKNLAAGGHLYDALAALESIRSTDAQKDEADRLRGDIQRQLLAVEPLPAPQPDREKVDRRVP
jgi:tetratricopeptide (TPR) repeat protein